MAKNKKKFDVGSADPKPSKTSILSNGQAYDRVDGVVVVVVVQW